MQLKLRKDSRRQYLVINSEEETKTNYKAKMIFNNPVAGFASCFSEMLDSEELFYYEIPFGYGSLSAYLKAESTDGRLYREILKALADAIENAREYLLGADGIVLNTDGIFLRRETEIDSEGVSTEKSDILFAYFPYDNGSFEDNCTRLSEVLLHNMDHNDKNAVDTGYKFYRYCVQKKICTDVLKEMAEEACVRREERKEEISATQTLHSHSLNTEELFVTDRQVQVRKEPEAPALKEPEDKEDYSFLFDEKPGKKPKKEKKKKKLFSFIKKKKTENTVKEEEVPVPKEDPDKEEENPFETVLLTRGGANRCRAVIMQMEAAEEGEKEAGQTVHKLTKDTYLMGKTIAGADIEIGSIGISRIHARLSWDGGRYALTDLGSRNGTFINGRRLTPGEVVVIESGNEIKLAKTSFILTYTDNM